MSILRTVEHEALRYTEHADNLHVFTFHVGSRKALDQWFFYIEQFYQFPKEAKVRALIDTTACEQPPLQYAFQKAQALAKKYPNRPVPMYFAFLGSDRQGAMNRILQSFIQLLRTGDQNRYFYGEAEREKAMGWLHSVANPDKVADGI